MDNKDKSQVGNILTEAIRLFMAEHAPIKLLSSKLEGEDAFIDSVSDKVMEKLIMQGYIEDTYLSRQEVMALIKVKSHMTMARLERDGILHAYRNGNSRPKYRKSQVLRYMRENNL